MLPSRTPTPMSGTQGGEMPTQSAFPSLVSPREQFNNTNMLGNTPNVSSLFNHSFSNGIPNNGGAEPDPMSNMGSSMSFSSTPSSMVQPNMSNQQPNNHHHQQQYQSLRGLNGVGHVKLEQQMAMGPIKLEAQQNQNNGTLPPIKLELQNSDQSLFLQQQQILNMSRQSPQAQINYLHQQRLMQLQKQQQLQQQQQQQQNQHRQQQQNQHQHQQQFALKSVPLQRSLSQLQQQNLASRSNVRPVYEPGMCARRLSRYMYEQRNRPEDNNIEFWKKFVSEFFAPNAKKKWCVSLYGDGRQTTGVFPQDVWQCEICNRKPGRGFEATAEVLPRLFKIKYESGTLEELLYVDMPQEYHNNSGQIVLDYAKAIQETVLDQLRVVRDGQLRLVFTPELKICSWEFCARRHEELIPRRLLIPQVSQLGAVAQQYQTATQNASSSMSVPELQDNCNMFVASARQLAKALEVPLVNDLGYTKRYVRCLQISEVVNSMKDLIDYSGETGMGPMESLAKFPRRTSSTPTNQSQIKEEPNLQQQQTVGQNSSNNDHNSSVQANTRQRASINGIASVNNSNLSTTSSSSNIVGIPHQSPMNNNPNGSYIGNGVHVPSPNSSSTISQPNLSPFVKSTPSTSNNNTIQDSHPQHDVNNSQTSVQKILQEMIMSPQMNDVKNVNRTLSTSNISGLNGGNVLMRNGFARSGMLNGIRDAMGNNSMSMNGRVGINAMVREQNSNQQQGLGDQFLNGLGFANGFNNLQVDWKPSR